MRKKLKDTLEIFILDKVTRQILVTIDAKNVICHNNLDVVINNSNENYKLSGDDKTGKVYLKDEVK